MIPIEGLLSVTKRYPEGSNSCLPSRTTFLTTKLCPEGQSWGSHLPTTAGKSCSSGCSMGQMSCLGGPFTPRTANFPSKSWHGSS